jgi:hypothetical protein
MLENISETGQLILGVCFLIAIIVITRRIHALKIKRSYLLIIEDLKSQGAFYPSSAVEQPYARKATLRIGVRDYRPTALHLLIQADIVGVTDDGKYYLKDKTDK